MFAVAEGDTATERGAPPPHAGADASPVPTWTADATGACTAVNDRWTRLTGRSAAEERGEGWLDGVHPDDRDDCRGALAAAVDGGRPFEFECRLRDRTGAHRWMLIHGAPVRTAGRVGGFAGVAIDVHDLRTDRERHRLVGEVAAALDAPVGVGERLQALVDLLAGRLADVCVVEMPQPDGALGIVACAAGDPARGRRVARMRVDAPMAADHPSGASGVMRTCRTVLVERVTADHAAEYAAASGAGPEILAELGADPVGSVLLVPLTARGRPLGVVILATFGDRRLGPGDRDLVERIGRRAGLAIDNARLLEQAVGTARRLGALQQATAALSSASTPEEVAAVAVVRARELLGAHAATLFEATGDTLTAIERHGFGDQDIGPWAVVPLSADAPITRAARTRIPVWLEGPEDWRRHHPALADEAARRGIVGAASLPLVVGEEFAGVLALSFEGERRFTGADRDTARLLAEACGQALVRARLQAAADAEGERARLLAEVSYALDARSSARERLAALVDLIVPALADLATVRLAGDAGGPAVLAAVAHRDPVRQELAEALYRGAPAADERPGPGRVIATGEPELVTEATEDMARAYTPDPAFARGVAELGILSYLSVPMTARGVVLGALTLMTTADSGRRYRAADLALVGEIGRRGALAIDNARRYEAELAARGVAERARSRTEGIQRVTAALSAALTQEEVAEAVVREAMQALGATGGAVAVASGNEGRVLVAAGRHGELGGHGAGSPLPGASPLATVLSTGEELWPGDGMGAGGGGASPGDPGPGGVALPLRVGGRVVGAIGLRFGEEPRDLAAPDRDLARALAEQCAQALDRARLYEREHHSAEVLQQALLPAGLPAVAAADVRVRYLPAGGGRSGGDFYDAIQLPDGRLSVVVGDVVGHGVEAAAVMGQLRSAWRAFALEGAGPAALLDRLDRFARNVPGAAVATVACAVLDGLVLSYACAGHPPPLLRRSGRAPAYLREGRGAPLAVPGAPIRDARARLEPGSLVLLYTDGVIERERDVDRGMAELATIVDDGPEDCAALLDRLAAWVGPEPADDCALLALRVPPSVPALRLTVAAEPAALRPARARLRRWLTAAGVGGPVAEDVVLAASEALANGVEHAYADHPDGSVRAIELIASCDASGLGLVVTDTGRWRPPHAPPGSRGRGLGLMRAVMDDVEVDRGPGGTTVRMRRRLDRAGPAPAPAPRRVRMDSAPPGPPVRLGEEIDAATGPRIGVALRALARERDARLVVDVSDVPHLGSAGVRLLVDLAAALRADGGRLWVVAAPGSLARRILDLTGAADALGVRDAAPG